MNTWSMVALDLEDLQICLEFGNLGMIGFIMITFLETMCRTGNYLKGDTRWVELWFLKLWTHL